MLNLCIFCSEEVEDNFYFYKNNPNVSSEILADLNLSKLKIFKCNNCNISYCSNVTESQLDNFYKKIFDERKINKSEKSGFNKRFFSQMLYFINHSKLFKNIRILEIGPNQHGIVPTIKIFQKKFKYYYYENLKIQSNNGEIVKLGDYWNPFKDKLPEIDLIWMSHSLEHIIPEHLTQVIKSFYNALSEGGKIFIEIPNDIEAEKFTMPHTLFFKTEGLIKLFKDHKFKIIAVSDFNKKQSVTDNPNNPKEKLSNLFSKVRQLIKKFIPNFFLELIRLSMIRIFINNGPYTQRPTIRMIVEK